MLIDFFLKLKSHKLPVSIKEYLTLLEAMDKKVIGQSVDEFYYLSRSALVKDEANFDKFDRAFAEFWQGVETLPGIETQVPLEWLLKQIELTLSEEEKKQIEALGGWEKLMQTLKQRLEEQKGRHQGGSKWIGTAGTSPFGAYGYNPEGVRIGQERSRNRSAVKVWDQREYRNLDDSVELGTGNIKVALRRLRKFAREGAPEEHPPDADPVLPRRAPALDHGVPAPERAGCNRTEQEAMQSGVGHAQSWPHAERDGVAARLTGRRLVERVDERLDREAERAVGRRVHGRHVADLQAANRGQQVLHDLHRLTGLAVRDGAGQHRRSAVDDDRLSAFE